MNGKSTEEGASETVCEGMPRWLEVLLSSMGLVILFPFLGIGGLLASTSRGPILYKQERVGLHGRKFVLYKFRSMRAVQSTVQVTASDDARVTWAGKLLRKTKIDELPELWNVLKGDMSFVGPRPEVEQYVDMNDPLWQQVLFARPGITDPVTLALRNEEEILGRVAGDRQQFYLETLQPLKLAGYIEYLRKRGCWSDVNVILKTVVAVILPGKAPSLLPERLFADRRDIEQHGRSCDGMRTESRHPEINPQEHTH
jgi:lipopolysaccharide/colanic/teichoic acid biosynthesis glycosyltransferase